MAAGSCLAIYLLVARAAAAPPLPTQPQDPFSQAFYPLTLPLTVGPGSISVAITLGANAAQRRGPQLLTILAALIGSVDSRREIRFAARQLSDPDRSVHPVPPLHAHASYFRRRSFLSILPTLVFGRLSTTANFSGTANFGISPRATR
jgi:hypothetical protein